MKRTVNLSLVLMLCLLGGCGGPLAWFQAMVLGPDPVPAEYTFSRNDDDLPEAKVLVLIDDPKMGFRDEPIASHLMDAINSDLKDKELAASTVSSTYFTRYTAAIPNFRQSIVGDPGIIDLAAKLDVTHVLVVRVDEFHLVQNPADTVYEPFLKVSCRVLDVSEKEQAWPTDQLWFPVEEIDRGTIAPGSQRTFQVNLIKELMREMSNRVTDLFRTAPGRDPSSLPKKDPTHPEWEHPTGA